MSEQRMPPLQADNSSIEGSSADILRALLARAELSQRGAALLLGIDERTVRMWCSGQGSPSASVYRALDPRLTYAEHLRERIEMNERQIEVLESGRHHELPRAYRPVDADQARDEIAHLRKRNEAYRAVLRLEESFHQMRDAHSVVFQQWLSPGCFGLTAGSIHAFDAAEQEFQAAKAALDQVTDLIRARCITYVSPAMRKE